MGRQRFIVTVCKNYSLRFSTEKIRDKLYLVSLGNNIYDENLENYNNGICLEKITRTPHV